MCASRTGERGAVAVSACLLGVACRYDGREERAPKVLAALAGRDVVAFCPEAEAGLGIPRAPVFQSSARDRFWQEGERDLTARFDATARGILDRLRAAGVRAAVVKERSPSCGLRRTEDERGPTEGPGRFTRLLMDEGVKTLTEHDFEDAEHAIELL
jgi:uncharacterized protein YbbK (DUF523 family)